MQAMGNSGALRQEVMQSSHGETSDSCQRGLAPFLKSRAVIKRAIPRPTSPLLTSVPRHHPNVVSASPRTSTSHGRYSTPCHSHVMWPCLAVKLSASPTFKDTVDAQSLPAAIPQWGHGPVCPVEMGSLQFGHRHSTLMSSLLPYGTSVCEGLFQGFSRSLGGFRRPVGSLLVHWQQSYDDKHGNVGHLIK